METYQAVIEGNTIQYIGKAPAIGKYKATVTINEIKIEDKEEKKKRLLSFAGSWTEEDVKLVEEIKEEQRNLPKQNRVIFT